MEGCFSCFYYNAKKEVSCLERRKKQILDKIACLQRDIVYAEEDQEKHERLIARHQALRRSLRTELRELAENVDELHQSHDNLSSQVQESKLQLEEIGAARDRLKDQVAAEALELQVVEAGCKRASLDLESAREEKEQVEAQVMRQREENDALRAEYERASMEARNEAPVMLQASTRFFAQQAIFRFGLWTALPLSLLHLLLAIFGLVFLDQAWAVYGEVAAMLAFDEGVTFEVWSDSEVMVAQAQSTVLSVYTLAYASAATLGGLLYDAASWEGIAIYHVAGLIVEVLVLAIQPAVHKSFREFVGCGAAIDKTDEVRPFSGATAIVPTASVASQNPTPESQRGQSLSLPGMVEGLAKRQVSHPDSEEGTPTRGANSVDTKRVQGGDGEANRGSMASQANRGSMASQANRGSMASRMSEHGGHARGSIRSRLTTRSAHTRHTARSQMTRRSAPEAGEIFEFHYGVTQALRPNIVSNNAQVNLDAVADEYGHHGRKSGVEEGESVAAPQGSGKLPRDLYLPAALIMLSSFNNTASYGIEFGTFAIFFKEVHGWESATWAGICQTAGDLLAAVVMAVLGQPTKQDLDELSGLRWLWHSLTGQPYIISCYFLGWVLLNFGMCLPWLPAAVASQDGGSERVDAFSSPKEINLFYSLGDSQVFLILQVLSRNADCLGGMLVGYLGLALYELEPISPFLFSGCVSTVAFIVYTAGMYCRVGFGKDIEVTY
eukprot:g31421.t1